MDLRIQIVAVVAAGILLFGILELVRRRRLLERYALLWIFSAAALLALAAWKGLLEKVANAIGIFYPPSALFVIAFGFILVLLLHFSIAVSKLADQSKVLAQRVALLEERNRKLEEAVAESGDEERAAPSRTFARPMSGTARR
jgi:hypothetical protein